MDRLAQANVGGRSIERLARPAKMRDGEVVPIGHALLHSQPFATDIKPCNVL
jgi:hypothetical protein